MGKYSKEYITEKLNQVFEELKQICIKDACSYFKFKYVGERLDEMITETVKGGKMIRGHILIDTILDINGDPTEEELHDTCVMAWLIEWMEAFFLVADDLMDKSLTRRGKTCWYLRHNNGEMALNDSFILESQIFLLIDHFFLKHKNYENIIQLFHFIIKITGLGQSMDLLLSSIKDKDFSNFTMDNYIDIVHHKTSYYTFALPLSLAYIYCDLYNEVNKSEITKLSLEFGEYFQIQDDYLDCFGDYKVLGKIGTDIEEGKLCWVFVNTINICNDEDKNFLYNNYKINDKDIVNSIKNIYRKYNIPDLYKTYEDQVHHKLSVLINESALPKKQVLIDLLNKLNNRCK